MVWASSRLTFLVRDACSGIVANILVGRFFNQMSASVNRSGYERF